MSNYRNENPWLYERLNGPESFLWLKAKKMLLLSKPNASAMDLIRANGQELGNRIGQHADATPRYLRWTENTSNSVRTLVDHIATRWKTEYLDSEQLNRRTLQSSLTDMPCQVVKKTYDKSDNDVLHFNVERAKQSYQACFVPLHYHELWTSIVNEYRSRIEFESRFDIDIQKIGTSWTLDETEKTATLLGTYSTELNHSLAVLSHRLVLFDLVLITIGNDRYFGIVLSVDISEIAPLAKNTTMNANSFLINLMSTVEIFVSGKCAAAFEQQRNDLKSKKLKILKISNMKSSRAMVNAIYDLSNWPQHRSILKPTVEDPYFQLPEYFDSRKRKPIPGFNPKQSKVIRIAESMCDDIQERLHMVHGPPGTGKSRTIARIVLNLSQKPRNQKLLLCAPSNKACDELLRRIIDEFRKKDVECKPGTVIRIGCQAPNDCYLSEYFLDHLVLQELVQKMKACEKLDNSIAKEIEKRIVTEGRIFISTLNYSSSSRLCKLRSKINFIIVDEATQSLEADLLIPLKFRCQKLMLVGDPKQLPPTVISAAGRDYKLDQSLYLRLYHIFEQCKSKNSPITMLTTQYRMHSELCKFPSQYFYMSCLTTHPSVDRGMAHFPLKPLIFYDLINGKSMKDTTKSSFNTDEVSCIQRFCIMLATHVGVWRSLVVVGTPATSIESNQEVIELNDERSIKIQKRIVVITPYQAQVNYLRDQLPPNIEVITTDSSQGSEKDIVIISCVRSNGSIGFLENQSRLNVMITRARFGLYVFGNLTWLSLQDDWWHRLFWDAHDRGLTRTVVEQSGITLPNVR